MKAFRATDMWGILGIMLFLIFVYLILKNYLATVGTTNAFFTGTNDLFKTLQGR